MMIISHFSFRQVVVYTHALYPFCFGLKDVFTDGRWAAVSVIYMMISRIHTTSKITNHSISSANGSEKARNANKTLIVSRMPMIYLLVSVVVLVGLHKQITYSAHSIHNPSIIFRFGCEFRMKGAKTWSHEQHRALALDTSFVCNL